jgi:hypothetical protein
MKERPQFILKGGETAREVWYAVCVNRRIETMNQKISALMLEIVSKDGYECPRFRLDEIAADLIVMLKFG